MRIFVFFLVIFMFCALTAEQVVVRFDDVTLEILRTFNTSNYDVAAYKPGEYLDIVIDANDYTNLQSYGYKVHITQTESQLSKNLMNNSDLAGYMNYDELLAELQQIEADNPDICKLYDIGDSRGKHYSEAGNANYDNYNHEIWALKISDNVESFEDEPSIYFLAEHHAREPISLEVAMEALRHIMDNYGTDPQITDNIDNTEVWFVPLVNPNGHKVVTQEINTMWRKNICDNNENGSLDVTGNSAQDGVDPNRNYGFMWGGASTNWTSETFQGDIYFSEPETQAIRDLVESHHFVAGLSYHSYSELILFPYGYADGTIAPDVNALQELAVDMASTIQGQNGGTYTPQASWALYSCTGTTDDWAYGEHGVFSYTVELATEFIPPANAVQGICDNNIQAAMIMLDRSSHAILKGHITDAITGEPIVAQIYVDGIDNTGVYRKPYESNDEFGSYYRLLTDGSYDVTFSAYGYEFQTVEGIVITDTDATVLNIILNPAAANCEITGVVADGSTFAPVENAIVEITDFSIPASITNTSGEFTISELYEYNYNIAVHADGYAAQIEQVEVVGNYTNANFILSALDDGTFENGELGACWVLEGQDNWSINDSEVYEGTYSVCSGDIGHNQFSQFSVSMYLENDDMISFYRKVSSEDTYDFLKFYVDDQILDQWSGNESWAMVSYDVPAGLHTFKWSYIKDGGAVGGSDCAWIDNIILPASALNVTPSVLDFVTADQCLTGKTFNLVNSTENEVVLNNIQQTGSVFEWYLDDFTLDLPYSMSAGEELEFTVKVALTTNDGSREILTEDLLIESDSGNKTVTINFDETLNVGTGDNPIALKTEFYGNYPNPFNPSTTFKFSLHNSADVTIDIYNVKGQLVKQLVKAGFEQGAHTVAWNGTDTNGKTVTSGIYFSKADINIDDGFDYTSVKKVILLK